MKILFLITIFALCFNAFAEDEKESFIDKVDRYNNLVLSMVQGSLDSRGLSLDTLFRPNVPSYDSILTAIDQDLRGFPCLRTDCDGFFKELGVVANAQLGSARVFKLLPSAVSFEKRRELILGAKKSIYILVWAIYNDDAGKEFRDLLFQALKANPELDVRIIVDGIMVNVYGKRQLRRLETESAGRIKVMKWKSRKYRASGSHRKMIVVDHEHVIVGGMNIGNNYAHIGKHSKWRDLDIYIGGKSAASNAHNVFVTIWNKQLAEFPKLKERLDEVLPVSEVSEEEGSPVLFVDQHPGSAVKESYHNIHTAVVKLFRSSQKSIDIENAYFIMDPIVQKELSQAIKRGVKVRILTNSDKSVDEPIVSMPVMHSARNAKKMGAEVYVRRGTTLHSKFMVVDGRISMIGSFNFHPRSLRFDAETVAMIDDEKVALELTTFFEETLPNEKFIENADSLKIDWNLMGFLTQSFYFDFL